MPYLTSLPLKMIFTTYKSDAHPTCSVVPGQCRPSLVRWRHDYDARIREHVRLLICRSCSTIEPLPWYDGPVEGDDILIEALAPHRTDGVPHVGSLITVSAASWEDPARRAELLGDLSGGSVMVIAE